MTFKRYAVSINRLRTGKDVLHMLILQTMPSKSVTEMGRISPAHLTAQGTSTAGLLAEGGMYDVAF